MNVFVGCFLPGTRAGGPIRSIANLMDAVGDRVEFSVFTLNHDFGETIPYPDVRPFQWLRHGQSRVKYLAPGWRALAEIVRGALDADADVIYLNSVFERRFSMLPLWARVVARRSLRRVVLAPRGELAAAALKNKPRRKAAYLFALRAAKVPERIMWMASSDFEKRDIERAFGKVSVRIAPPLPAEPRVDALTDAPPKQPGQLRVLFVGRVLPHKGLHVALKCLSGLREGEGEVELEIAGPIEDPSYWNDCQSTIDSLPVTYRVRHLGVLDADALADARRRADLFILPTRSENFGHAIAEALGAGLPVLISDGTPWRNLEREGVGWDLPIDDTDGFIRALRAVLSMDHATHRALRARAVAFAKRMARLPDQVDANAAIFADVARTTATPNEQPERQTHVATRK
ncbi:MAG: glycosyltransferase [Myxococcales bacterium]|nr:glycosyltransferase [Myxococcales bacterium]